MAKARIGARILSALLLMSGASSVWAANPTADDLLKFRPKQEGVEITTPSENQIANCTVEVIKGEKGSGYLLRDADGRPLRRFFDSDGDRYIDVWSYFLNGEEVYREVDTNANHKADQYRWMGPAGSKIGIDLNEDGKIDRWEMISPEEVSQEILQAIITRDFERLKALMVNDADLKTLELSSKEAARIKEKLAGAQEKFNATTASLINLSAKTQWMHVELSAPQCLPADATGGGKDIFRYKGGTILYQNAGKADFVQTGEMILVGRAWKIIDAPMPGHAPIEEPMAKNGDGPALQISEEIKPMLAQLQQIDESIKDKGLSDPSTAVRYNIARANVLEKIVAKTSGRQQDDWTKQLADCLSAAAQNSPANDSSSYQRIVALSDRARKAGSAKLAGYVAYREMSADYTRRLNNSGKNDIGKVQDYWRERLKKFVTDFPSADDAPDALLQLGMVSEFMGKEAEAKNWYSKLAKEYTASPLSKKAQGCLRRLDMEGKPIELAGPKLGTQETFDISALSGKVVVVYYWASWNGQCVSDFNRLKALHIQYKSKGLELVCINLDNNQMDAVNFLRNNNLDAVQMHQQGALDSALAQQYGILVLPNMFLVGKDGKVVSRSVQITGLEEEIKKLLEK